MTENPVSVSQALTPERPIVSPRRLILPLALAQFICSFAGSNMNVMINDISDDLDTTVKGVQTTITLFLLIMAVGMIPCSKLTERWGRKRCFTGGLTLYGIGALLSAVSPGLGVLILGNSVLEGVGTAFLIPPVYILATMAFTSLESRAKAFGVISGLGGIGAAAGPLIGGLITSGISWRAAFLFQAAVVGTIVLLSRHPRRPDLLCWCGTIRQAAFAEDVDLHRVRRDRCRDRSSAWPGQALVIERVGARAGALSDRVRSGWDADAISQRRAVGVPRREAGRDFGAVAQRLQSRLDFWHGDRRHDPRLESRIGQWHLRCRDDRPRRARGRWSGGSAFPTSQSLPGCWRRHCSGRRGAGRARYGRLAPSARWRMFGRLAERLRVARKRGVSHAPLRAALVHCSSPLTTASHTRSCLLGKPGPRQTVSPPSAQRHHFHVRRRLATARRRLDGAWLQDLGTRLGAIDFGNAIVLFGASLLLCALPRIILLPTGFCQRALMVRLRPLLLA